MEINLFGKRFKKRNTNNVSYLLSDTFNCVAGYTPLSQNPEVITACRRIAELLGSITIHLMSNSDRGDIRIVNELSRIIDINPMPNMTRSTWVQAVVMNLLLYGNGNAVVLPHTKEGLLDKLEPIAAERVNFVPSGYTEYEILIDGVPYANDDILHFVYNPDRTYLWKGTGVRLSLKSIVQNLAQAEKTKNAFMKSEWKPPLIVKVDALTEAFASEEGRRRLLDDYIKTSGNGEPWLIPAEQFSVEQVKPLTLADLAINDSVELDKRQLQRFWVFRHSSWALANIIKMFGTILFKTQLGRWRLRFNKK